MVSGERSGGIGDRFQQELKYQRGHLPAWQLDWRRKPETYKEYPSAPRVELDEPDHAGGAPLWSVLEKRRSVRHFSTGEPMTKAELSQLLWAAQGVTTVQQGYAFRTAPSAGALYPVETYIVVNAVADVKPGVYHYAVASHELEQLRTGDFRLAVARAALDQEMAYHAPVVFIWTAVFARSTWKYQQRAYRYVYLDAGHIAQNVALAAVGLGLGSCQIGALYDEDVNALVDVDGVAESVVYLTVVGRPL
ncbi:MAG TPA: SagB/ThcOx family dehydrogenase [Methanomicrobia archaeon]|nr:SagB/ThcOx family dehydrogenase [Methanomicrobia archaeon]